MSTIPFASFLARPAGRFVHGAATLLPLLLVAPLAGSLPALAQSQQQAQPTVTANDFREAEGLARVLMYLRQGGDPNIVLDRDGNTLMHYAASVNLAHDSLGGRASAVLAEAIAREGDCDARNSHGVMPIHIAASRQGDSFSEDGAKIVRPLIACTRSLSTGSVPGAKDSYGNTPLHAVYEGAAGDFVHAPSLSTAGILEHDGEYNRSLEERDFYHGGAVISIAKVLLDAGADSNARDAHGGTPLMMAIRYGIGVVNNLEHVRLLLSYRADAGARDPEYGTLLIATQKQNHIDRPDESASILTALLRAGADPDARDRNGDTALLHAVKFDSPLIPEVEALLAAGANPCIADREGKRPIEHTQSSAIIRLLRDAGGDNYYDSYAGYVSGTCARDEMAQRAEKEKEGEEKVLALSASKRRHIQTCLNALNLNVGTPDGIFGPRTRAAIRVWQSRRMRQRENRPATGFLTTGDVEFITTSCDVATGPTPQCTGTPGQACWMEVSNKRGCYIWNSDSQQNETVTWSGDCANSKASGKGRVAWSFVEGGARKTSGGTGELRDGRTKHGHWVDRLTNGDEWEGPYVNGKRDGFWAKRGAGGSTWVCFNHDARVDNGACLSDSIARQVRAWGSVTARIGPGNQYQQTDNLDFISGGDMVIQATGRIGQWFKLGGRGFIHSSLVEEETEEDRERERQVRLRAEEEARQARLRAEAEEEERARLARLEAEEEEEQEIRVAPNPWYNFSKRFLEDLRRQYEGTNQSGQGGCGSDNDPTTGCR